ncbi:hypothetical protein FHR84_003006 [Actinopolyspora biskrensis]|uniref:Uncharacterized protein n=1 Tax=Actinopolyspora biskrensis TaxID=1470178 RepID=A0A852YZR1_9ACTN|nr:hypothetical protein [Actinopolyspora biskrensis]NYH79668.1 hypothetical protein [Actinopolyspora biskrensis]
MTSTPTMAATQEAPRSASTAARDAGSSCSAQGSSAESTTEMTLVEGQDARDLTGTAFEAVKNGEISVQAPQSALSRGQAKVYTVDSEETTSTSVTIPVGGDYSLVSNLTVLFDESGDIVQYSETLISENESGNFNITSFTDGVLVNSNDTDQPYMTDDQLRQGAGSGTGSSDSMTAMGAGSTAACVAAVLGVSGATGYLIVSACTGACATPGVGTGVCVACIGAYATVGSASVTAVASCFG